MSQTYPREGLGRLEPVSRLKAKEMFSLSKNVRHRALALKANILWEVVNGLILLLCLSLLPSP